MRFVSLGEHRYITTALTPTKIRQKRLPKVTVIFPDGRRLTMWLVGSTDRNRLQIDEKERENLMRILSCFVVPLAMAASAFAGDYSEAVTFNMAVSAGAATC